MKQTYLRDQRGVAMVLELVLVVAVLGLVVFAVYQAGHSAKLAGTSPTPTPANTAAGLAASAAAQAISDSAADDVLAAEAESATSELDSADSDVTTLGRTSDASF